MLFFLASEDSPRITELRGCVREFICRPAKGFPSLDFRERRGPEPVPDAIDPIDGARSIRALIRFG